MKSQLKIIAEIGVNHNGRIDLATKLVDEAKKCGAHAVKFQTFFAKNFVTKNTPKVKYQKKNTSSKENHYQMINKLELKKKDFLKIKNYYDKKKIEFISTPYDLESAEFLSKINVKTFKVASADLSDYLLHKFLSKLNKKVILSSGMSTIEDIKKTLRLYKNKNNLELLHCVSNYPCSYESLNLNCIKLLKKKFSIPIGFSDHSIGNDAAIIAYAMGSRTFEKHFTLSKNMKGPDHQASSDPKEFKEYVNKLKTSKIILGTNVKKIWPEEIQMKKISTKSITLKNNLKKGQKIKIENIIMKRPGLYLNGFHIKKILGKKIKKNLHKDYQIKLKDIY